MAGGNVWDGLWKGALFGGVAGAAGGYLQHVAFENSLFDTDLMQANKQRKTYFGGTLDEVVVRGRPLPPLSNGAIKPNYFFEDLFVGGAIFKPIGAMFGMFFGGAAKGTMSELSALKPTHYLTRSKTQMQNLVDDIRANGIKEATTAISQLKN